MVNQVAKHELIKCFCGNNVDFDYAFRIEHGLDLPKEMVNQAAKEGMIYWISKGNINAAIEIMKKFDLPKEMVNQAAKEGLIKRSLPQGEADIDKILKIINKFSLSDDIVNQVAKEGLMSNLANGSVRDVIMTKDGLNLSTEIVQSQEVQQAAKQRFIDDLSRGSFDFAPKLKTYSLCRKKKSNMLLSNGSLIICQVAIFLWP